MASPPAAGTTVTSPPKALRTKRELLSLVRRWKKCAASSAETTQKVNWLDA